MAGTSQQAPSSSDSTDSLRRIVVRSNPNARIGQEILIGPHRLTSDEPAPTGEDTGPTPYNLLAASLGSCTAMTLTLYAQHKNWPLENVSVTLIHRKIEARDCTTCTASEGKVDHIERTIELEGPLSSEQRERLLAIAEKCPVRRTLGSEIHVESRLLTPTP